MSHQFFVTQHYFNWIKYLKVVEEPNEEIVNQVKDELLEMGIQGSDITWQNVQEVLKKLKEKDNVSEGEEESEETEETEEQSSISFVQEKIH